MRLRREAHKFSVAVDRVGVATQSERVPGKHLVARYYRLSDRRLDRLDDPAGPRMDGP